MSQSLYTVIVTPLALNRELARVHGESLARDRSEWRNPPAHDAGPGYLIVRTDLLPTLKPIPADSFQAGEIRLLRNACEDRKWQDAVDVLDRLVMTLGITHEAKVALDGEAQP